MSTPLRSVPEQAERWCEDVRFVRALARRLVRDVNLADDIAQDAWLQALRERAQQTERFRAWIATVVRNLVTSHHRRERRRLRGEDSRRDDSRSQPEPASAIAMLEAHQVLITAVRGLDEPYQAAIVQRYFEGLSPSAIAQRTGEPVRTVHTRLQRALAQLRARLRDRDARWPAALLLVAFPSRGTAALLTMATTTKVVLTTTLCAAAIAWVFLARTDEPAVPPNTLMSAEATAFAADQRVDPTAPEQPAPPMQRAAVDVVDQGDESPWLVAGLLLDTTGTPLADVGVVFEIFGVDSAHARGISRRDGSFELELPAVAGGHVSVDDPDWTAIYRPVLWGQRGVGERDLTVVATRCAPISGQVVDDFGQPVASASVSVNGTVPERANFARSLEKVVSGEWRTISDDRGHFVIGRAPILPDMSVAAGRRGYHSTREALTVRERVRIVLMRGEVLVGQVVDEKGRPIEAAVFCHPAGTMSDAAGRFELDISGVADRWLVAARDGHLPGRLQCAGQPNLVASWPQPIVLELGGTPLTIRGRVVAADGRPLGALQVRVADPECLIPGNEMSAIEFLARVDSRVTPDGAEFSERSHAELPAGEFEVRGLQHRTYRLHVEDRESLLSITTAPIQAGSTDVVVQLPADAIWPAVEGIVVDRHGNPIAGAAVFFEFTPDVDGAARRTDQVTTDEQGRFVRGPLVRVAATALVQAPGTAVPKRVDIGRSADARRLRLTAPVRTNVRIVATQAADNAAFFDGAGNPVFATITHGSAAWGSHLIPLTDGASEFVVVPDDAVTLVLTNEGREVTRLSVELRPGEAQVLRP